MGQPHHIGAQVWHAFSMNHTAKLLPATQSPTRFIPRMELSIPANAFPAEAVPHLPTPEGWKAELAWAPPW